MRKIIVFLMLILGSLAFSHVLAQESTNFKLEEHVFNDGGGHPDGGVILTS